MRRLPFAGLLWVSICLLRCTAHGADGAATPVQATLTTTPLPATATATLVPATPTVTPVREPVAAAINAIVEAGHQPLLHRPDFSGWQAAARQLYEATEFQPLWARNGKPTAQATEILRLFSEADRRGLSPEDYDTARLREAAARFDTAPSPSPADVAGFDTALTIAVLRYASDAHFGRVPPRAVGFALETNTGQFDPVAFVSQLVASDAPAQQLTTLDPQVALFGPLMKALAHWRELAARPNFPQVPALPKLRPGQSDAGVVPLREFLRALGELPSTARAPKNPRIYDPELVKAVKQFQDQHGLGADGVIGEATLSQLQITPAARVRQIELAMERLRWLPPANDDAFVIVNLPEFQLRGYYRGESTPAVQLRAVVGSASLRHETPVLHADMQYVVFRPYWDVPPSIAKKELLPDAQRDPSYFAKHNYEFHKGRIRQRPGDDNALGLLKFVFPNPFHVYMHDTPTKRLFAKSRRDFSHGCIRVSDAAALAEFVLRGQGKWDREGIATSMKSGPNNRRVYLERPVGVYLVYSTVAVDADGTTHFFEDIYGHDARLEAALAKPPQSPYPIRAPTMVKAEAQAQ